MKLSEVDSNLYIEIKDVETIQKELCKLFLAFHEICEEHNLIYNMYGGTLLGAVRHGTIIPWDDDVDVSMPREDYEKFIDIVRKCCGDKYVAHVFPQKNYPYPYMKFGKKDSLLIEPLRNKYNKLTLYIDIFPIDGCSDDQKVREKDFAALKKLKHKRGVCVDRIKKLPSIFGKCMNVLRHCRAALYKVAGYRAFLKKEIEISKQYDFNSSKYVCCMASSWFEKGIVTREEYLDRVLYKFGEHEFWGMRDYDRHLTNLYGNYMQPPPIEERGSNHNYHLYFERSNFLEENYG